MSARSLNEDHFTSMYTRACIFPYIRLYYNRYHIRTAVHALPYLLSFLHACLVQAARDSHQVALVEKTKNIPGTRYLIPGTWYVSRPRLVQPQGTCIMHAAVVDGALENSHRTKKTKTSRPKVPFPAHCSTTTIIIIPH